MTAACTSTFLKTCHSGKCHIATLHCDVTCNRIFLNHLTAISTGTKSPRIYQAYLSELVESAVVLPDVVLAQVRDGIGVVHAFERPLRGLEVGVEIAKEVYEGGVEDVLDDITHQVF